MGEKLSHFLCENLDPVTDTLDHPGDFLGSTNKKDCSGTVGLGHASGGLKYSTNHCPSLGCPTFETDYRSEQYTPIIDKKVSPRTCALDN